MVAINDDFRAINYYDAFQIKEDGSVAQRYTQNTNSLRIFGNAHVGQQELTNLQSAGQIEFDRSVLFQRWYARTDAENMDQMMSWAEWVIVTLEIGHHRSWLVSLSDLLLRRPRYAEEGGHERVVFDPAAPVLVPIRQYFAVRIDVHNHHARDRMAQWMATRSSEYLPHVWIHLEGVSVRDGAGLSKAIDRITSDRRTRDMPVTDRICRYLTQFKSGAPEDAEADARVDVIRDGIIEGRHLS